MRWRETAASVSSGGIAARARDASVWARSTSNGVARPDALPRSDEPQRLVLRGRNRAHGLELAQRADQGEVVARDVGQHEQAYAPCTVFGRHGVGGRRRGTGSQATGQIDFPGDIDARAEPFDIRNALLDRRVVAGALIHAHGADADARPQPRTTDRLPGSRRTHALGGDLDIAVLTRRAADEVGQHRVTVAFPPDGLGLFFGDRGGRESAGHVDRRLNDRRRAARQSERERRSEHSHDARRPFGAAKGHRPGQPGHLRNGCKVRHYGLALAQFEVGSA